MERTNMSYERRGVTPAASPGPCTRLDTYSIASHMRHGARARAQYMSVAGRARGRPSNASTIENQKSEHVSTRVFKPTSRLGRTERDPARRATGKWSSHKHDAREVPTP